MATGSGVSTGIRVATGSGVATGSYVATGSDVATGSRVATGSDVAAGNPDGGTSFVCGTCMSQIIAIVYLNNIIIISQGTNMVIDGDALKAATDNFSDIVGRGGFGVVYRGSYHHVDVAVKVLNKVMRLYDYIYRVHVAVVVSRNYVILKYRKGLRA